MIRLSIILPSYNVADYIEECLNSVLAQEIGPIEIICVDAWSDDGTLEIINNYAVNDGRIRLFCSDIKSYGKQVNIGIEAARGEYISIIETDDYIEPNMLKHLYWNAKKNKAQVVKTEYKMLYGKGDEELCENAFYIPKNIRTQYAFDTDVEAVVHNWDSYIWNGIYQKDFLNAYKIRMNESPGAAYQDIGFQHKVLNYADRIMYIRGNYYNYRVAREGASSLNRNCLRYVYQEYKNIIESTWLKKGHFPFVLLRMHTAFTREIGKALMFEEAERDPDIDEEFEWFIKTIVDNNEKLLFSRNILSDEQIECYKKIFDNYKEYKAKQEEEILFIKRWYREFTTRLGDFDLVLFGCGKRGIALCHFFLRNKCKLVDVVDNDCNKLGKAYGPFIVSNPKDAIRKHPDAVFCISNKNNTQEICSQLKEAGIKDNQIELLVGDFESIPSIAQRHPEIIT
ncbi:glycosyltransferase [Butyrivibrio sp. AC2005]|uniref:glycosyltransferase n=1 Tax=Butyrivibrio sp. AC2005 TaxID=1280672 RepID=UPI000405FF0C|nr:glycosyltransferase [Butyrivibrio sp. AC2005]